VSIEEKEMETRVFKIGEIRSETRTAEATLSTEYPVRRYDGDEVLSHEPDAVDLSRAPLPLIVAHDGDKLPVGLVENMRIEDKTLKGSLRFSKNADEIWNDVKDGILRNLSIGYQIIKRAKTKAGYIATKWAPYECSLVAAGADPLAGIGRKFNQKENRAMDKNDVLKRKKAAVEELAEIAKAGEDEAKMDELKAEIRSLDNRLEAFDLVEQNKGKDESFKPEIHEKQDRALITFEGGPAYDRTFAGMFNQKRKLEVNEDELRAFRASMVEGLGSSGGFSVPDPLAAKWLDDALPNEIVRPRATVWPMTSATRDVPGWDGADQSSSLYGGFWMEFLAEEASGSKQVGKLRKKYPC
jgi:HK97 family phage prohead protease